MTKKLMIVESDDLDINGRTIEEVLEILADFLPSSKISFNEAWENDTSFVVQSFRPETDEEYENRLKYEAVIAENALAQKYRLLAQLKKELGEK